MTEKIGTIDASEVPDEVKIEIIVHWLIENMCFDIMPPDAEDREDGMLYNLVHLARDGFGNFEPYAYKPYQDEEIESWDL